MCKIYIGIVYLIKIIQFQISVAIFVSRCIDWNILYYNKNKIQIQMSVLFPNIFETKQYATYPSNRCFLFTV